MRSESMFRRRERLTLVAALALGTWLAPSTAAAAGRVALVVGNSAYAAIGTLPNPGNDAADVASALGRLGFDVTTVRDADRAGMNEALRLFARDSAGADVAVVFYAGHGLEVDGVNYLVPVDARLERDTDVEYEALALDRVLRATAGASLRVVILDACRNNPLTRAMQRTGVRRSVSQGSFGDLDESLLGDETLVAYAAAAGTTAADGEGRNSPYTEALLTYLEEPLELGLLFREVRARVLESTDGQQRPHEYASLLGEHYLRGTSQPGADAVAAAASVDVQVQQENLFWQSIADSSDAADFEAYLEQFPRGGFTRLARNRLAALRGAASESPPGPTAGGGSLDADRPGNPAPGATFRDCPSCPEMVVVPAGTFRMGCEPGNEERCYDDEKPGHRVQVRSFAMSKYEVTRSQYAAFVAATGHNRRGCRVFGWRVVRWEKDYWGWEDRDSASWRNPGFEQDGDHPVVCVSWEDAQAYTRWLTVQAGSQYRLPSEAEWEYAARAATTTVWYWGADDRCAHANGHGPETQEVLLRDRAWRSGDNSSYAVALDSVCADGAVHTAHVGSYAPNGFGLYDVAGNVSEWVQDCWHPSYEGAPRSGSAWTVDCAHGYWPVVRSGSWLLAYGGPWTHRFRGSEFREESRQFDRGFRVAKALGLR